MMKNKNYYKKSLMLTLILIKAPMVLISSCSTTDSLRPETSSRFLKPKRFLVKEGTQIYNDGDVFILPEDTNVVTLEQHREEITRLLVK